MHKCVIYSVLYCIHPIVPLCTWKGKNGQIPDLHMMPCLSGHDTCHWNIQDWLDRNNANFVPPFHSHLCAYYHSSPDSLNCRQFVINQNNWCFKVLIKNWTFGSRKLSMDGLMTTIIGQYILLRTWTFVASLLLIDIDILVCRPLWK